MEFEQIFSGRIDSKSTGQDGTIKLKPRGGGRRIKTANLMVKVLDSSGANVRITVELWHGPDGTAVVLHSTPVSLGDPGTAYPGLLSGDADQTKFIGETLLWVLRIRDSALSAAQWAQVEVYETRKPF
jgi:hypothetical protein